MGTAIKHSMPDRVKPSFEIFDIRALWRSGLSVSARMSKITNGGLIRSSTGCFIAVPTATVGVKVLNKQNKICRPKWLLRHVVLPDNQRLSTHAVPCLCLHWLYLQQFFFVNLHLSHSLVKTVTMQLLVSCIMSPLNLKFIWVYDCRHGTHRCGATVFHPDTSVMWQDADGTSRYRPTEAKDSDIQWM